MSDLQSYWNNHKHQIDTTDLVISLEKKIDRILLGTPSNFYVNSKHNKSC